MKPAVEASFERGLKCWRVTSAVFLAPAAGGKQSEAASHLLPGTKSRGFEVLKRDNERIFK